MSNLYIHNVFWTLTDIQFEPCFCFPCNCQNTERRALSQNDWSILMIVLFCDNALIIYIFAKKSYWIESWLKFQNLISDFLIQLSLALNSDISQINQLLKCQHKNQSFSTRNYKVKHNLIIFFLYLLKWRKCEKQNTRKKIWNQK